MENHSSQSITSTLPDKLVELSVWADPNSFSCLHALGRDRTSARAVPLLISRNARPVGLESGSRPDASTHRRIFYLAGGICQCRSCFSAVGPNSTSFATTGRERCCRGSG